MLLVIKCCFNLRLALPILFLFSVSGLTFPENILNNNKIVNDNPPPILTEVGSWQLGLFKECAVDNQRELAFISSGTKVLIFDISNISSPVLLNDNISASGTISDIVYDSSAQQLYLALNERGIELWDVSNFNDPQMRSSILLDYLGATVPAEQITYKPGYIFAAAGFGGVITINISDPSNPYQSFQVTYLSSSDAVAINETGNVLVTANSIHTASFNVSNNGSLTLLSDNVFYEDVGGSAISIKGNYSYQDVNGVLYIMNVNSLEASLANYSLIGNATDVYSIAISGNELYNVDPFFGIEIFDISNPTSLVLQGTYQTQCLDISYFSGQVIVPDVIGMNIINVSDPSSPQLTYSYATTGGYSGYGMKVMENFCYYPTSSGLDVLDISDPENPVLVGINQPASGYDAAAAFNGNYAYVTNNLNGFRVVDISNPEDPVTIGISTPGNFNKIISAGNYVYVNDELTTLKIFDVSDPASPVQVGSLGGFTDYLSDIIYSDGYIYASVARSGMEVIDVSDPTQPTVVAQYGQNVWYEYLTKKNNYVYISEDASGYGRKIDIIDVSDPLNPVLAGSKSFPSNHPSPYFMKIIGNILFAADFDPFITFLDISDPVNPVEIGFQPILDTYRGLDASNGNIYIATFNAGLHIYDDPFNITPVELASFTASADDNNVTLNWQTATETNNSEFEIQRLDFKNQKSENPNWKKIGFVEGKGTSTKENNYSFTDKDLNVGNYSYRLVQIDFDGTRSVSEVVSVKINSAPEEYSLSQNYPNPFNPATTIKFAIPENSQVKLIIYNSLGEQIKTLVNGFKPAGNYTVNFNASKLVSGIYYYRLESTHFNSVKKMILLK